MKQHVDTNFQRIHRHTATDGRTDGRTGGRTDGRTPKGNRVTLLNLYIDNVGLSVRNGGCSCYISSCMSDSVGLSVRVYRII